MPDRLEVDYACSTEAGGRPFNADAADARIPSGDLLLKKGVAAAIADGRGGSNEAGQVCVTGFLSDYFSTPDSWRVKTAASRVLNALNSWICGQEQQRCKAPRCMITTFSAAVIKSTTAHLLHVGDSRIYLCRGGRLEPLTRDHRAWASADRKTLTRAMGFARHLEIDYQALPLKAGDRLLFTTDGVHDFLSDRQMQEILQQHPDNLQLAAREITRQALRSGSDDNATCQLLAVITLPGETEGDLHYQARELPFPPNLKPGMNIDGYGVQRRLYSSRRSEVFLVVDSASGEQMALKAPSIRVKGDPELPGLFLNEEWIGLHINNPHVMKIHPPRRRRFLYHVGEYIEGQTLRQVIDDRGRLGLPLARDYLSQAVAGLLAFHRLEIVHRDLAPDNLMIDASGLLRIIDFGAARIEGAEPFRTQTFTPPEDTLPYTAPEILAGERGNRRSDIFSLGVISYEMLTGQLPYGDPGLPLPPQKMHYRSARDHVPELPTWVDAALKRATEPSPMNRYDDAAAFLQDMTRPNDELLPRERRSLLRRIPVSAWVVLVGLLLISNLATLILLLLGQ